ncbi:MAG: addiction module protein [Spirulinaceae cyanobacterium]
MIENVLQLSPPDRLKLLDVIYFSLEKPNEAIDNVWYDEAERRLSAWESGRVQGVPAADVLGDRP